MYISIFIKLQDIYNLFISAFHKYLGFKSKLQVDIRKSYENEDNDSFECPACPQVCLIIITENNMHKINTVIYIIIYFSQVKITLLLL